MRHRMPAEFEPRGGGVGMVGACTEGWTRLGETAQLPTQHPDFVQAAASAYLADKPQTLIEGVGPAGVDAAASLVRDHGFASRWRPVGDFEIHEPIAPLMRDGSAADLLAERLCTLGRAVEFSRIPHDSPLVPAIGRAASGTGVLLVRRAAPCPYLDLDARWCEPESRFSARRRSDFRRARRRAEAFGRVEYAMHRPRPEDFDALFEEAIAVEARSWKSAAGTAILRDAAKRAFFRTYLHACCVRGETRIAAMRIDGNMVAMQLALVWRERYWLYKIGFDEAYARCSPGTLLMLQALGECAREGLAGFEMMGEADPWITDFWTRRAHQCLRLRFYPPTPRGLAALAGDGLAWMRHRLDRRGGGHRAGAA